MNIDSSNDISKRIVEQTLKCIVEQTATVFGIEPKSLKSKQCSDSAIVTAASIMTQMGVADEETAGFFGENRMWLERTKSRFSTIQNDPRFKLSHDNSQMALLTMAALDGQGRASSTARPVITSLAPNNRSPLEGVCIEVLEKAAAHFEIPRAKIIAASDAETKEMRNKCVKAMKDAGATLKEIKAALGLKNDAAVYYILDRVDPEDGDLEMIKVEKRPAFEANKGARSQGRQASESQLGDGGKSDDLLDAVIKAVAKMKGLEASGVLSGSSHKESRARLVCWKASGLLDMKIGVLAVKFGRPKPSIQTSLRRISKEEEEEAQTIARVVQAESLKSDIIASSAGQTEETDPQPRVLRKENIPVPAKAFTRNLETLEEKVCAVFCSRHLLSAPDPIAEINSAKEVMIYLAALSMDREALCASLGITESEMHRVVGKVVIKVTDDPVFAKKVRGIQKSVE